MKTKKIIALVIVLCLAVGMTPAVSAAETYENAHRVVLSSVQNADGSYTHSAWIDDAAAEEFDYVWHADPSVAHDEVKNAPAEYYTGDEPDTDAAAYIAHDVYY